MSCRSYRKAEIKSGTLITSKLATEYNREVLTIPGSIFFSALRGPHMLLRLGATPIRNADDILEALNIGKLDFAKGDDPLINCSEREILKYKNFSRA